MAKGRQSRGFKLNLSDKRIFRGSVTEGLHQLSDLVSWKNICFVVVRRCFLSYIS